MTEPAKDERRRRAPSRPKSRGQNSAAESRRGTLDPGEAPNGGDAAHRRASATTTGDERTRRIDPQGFVLGSKPVTADWLFRAAAHYLQRYASSTENLARVLERKIDRRLRAAETAGEPFAEAEADPARLRAMVAETVARFVELKLLDDQAYAEARFASLRRRGTSLRQAAAKLGQKGVPRETLAAVAAADEMGDEAAALAYAKRRRLGPHRLRDREARRERDIAAMMRAGFSYRDSLAAIDAPEEEGA